jgi:hypothetical protein
MDDGVAQAVVPDEYKQQESWPYIHSWHGSMNHWQMEIVRSSMTVGTTQPGWSAGPEIGWRPKGETGDKKAVRWSRSRE